MHKRIAAIGLNLIPEVRFLLNKKIIAHGNPSEIFLLSVEELTFFLGCTSEVAQKIKNGDWLAMAEQETAKAKELDINIYTYFDKEYPSALKVIDYAPLVLYVKGDHSVVNELSIAVVGTRYPTVYGMNATEKLVFELAKKGLIIVSGLARGIDAIAHKTCMKAGSKTIAVLGCGISIDYPKENAPLKHEISTKGALISEFSINCKPYKDNFPLRNRIISALSAGVLVVEASDRSGALITARYALEQGKEVFAVPGSIFSLQSLGTNYLIKKGHAKLIQKTDDIIEEIPHYLKKHTKLKIESPLIEINPEEKFILNSLPTEETIYLDDLSLLTDLKPAALLPILLQLELKGLIIQMQGQRYYRKVMV